ncbi:hypothetical protein JKF63_07825 [Porcisia hertigi]|uniref:Uncharacterized protein n=1 Tax=Porcisia hertigi TaxID=2761500 RepID=A0A836LMI1_9TRYP|nr:hypothetical protein JKF63_07825 [Porcisia hertigi]
MGPRRATTTTRPYRPLASIYDAWGDTLFPFLVPAMVLSVWPVMMIIRARNRTPIKLLGIAALVSLADGLLGSCAFALQHQYAFSLSTNSAFFYAGTVTYWLGGAVLGPVMEMWGFRRSCMALAAAGIAGAWGSGQSIVAFALVGRISSAAATSGLMTWVEYALFHEGPVHRSPVAGAVALEGDDKTMAMGDTTEDLGRFGLLTMFHQIRPIMMWLSMLVSQYVMVATPTVSSAPCWAAAACYLGVLVVLWSFTVLHGTSAALSVSSRSLAGVPRCGSTLNGAHRKSLNGKHVSAYDLKVAGMASSPPPPSPLRSAGGRGGNGSVYRNTLAWRVIEHYMHAYATAMRTLFSPRYMASHIVVIVFGAVFFTSSLLWVPTLELYDDSIPFGLVFQLFMIATFLGCTFTLPVWAVGGAEAALVFLLSLSGRTLFTSQDYAIPVTIMLSGVVLHLTHGALLTMSSLWRAEYPSASASLTFLFMMKACTGCLGWVFLHAIDGVYMEEAFVFKARWIRRSMWVAAVALAQFIVSRMAPRPDRRAYSVASTRDDGVLMAHKGDSADLEDSNVTPV